MKSKMRKKLIAFLLCMVLVICNSVSILADTPAEATTTVEKQTKETRAAGENTSEKDKSEEDTSEDDSKEASDQAEKADEEDSDQEEAPEVKTTEKKEDTTEATTEKKEEDSDKADEVTTEDKEDATTATTESEETTTEVTTEDKATTEAADETAESDKKKEATTTENSSETSGTTEETTEVADETTAPTELTYENDDVKITVSANTENAIPEGTTLQVVPVVNSGDTAGQYQEVEQQLGEKATEEEYDITGFLAYDISLIDEDGNEIEPDGEVQVSMDYKNSVSPVAEEKALTDSDVTVMHLEEDENGQVKEVVDMAENSQLKQMDMTDKNEIQKTEFVTKSFSVFTIIWTYQTNKRTINLNIHPYYGYIENGEFIQFEGENIKKENVYFNQETLNLNTYKEDKYTGGIVPDGYSFSEIKLEDPQTLGTSANYLKIYKSSYSDNYKLQYSNNQHGWYSDLDHYTRLQANTTYDLDVYYIYTNDNGTGSGDGGGTVVGDVTLSKTKQAIRNDDGTYDLTLSIKGEVGSVREKAKIDVVMVLDTSGSMKDNGKMQSAQNAVATLVNSLSEQDTVDARYSVVNFADEGQVLVDWTKSSSYVKTVVNRLDPNGGTNYEDGLGVGQSQLNNAREGAQTILIFLTDGEPTFHNTRIGVEGGGSFTKETTYEHSLNAARSVSASQFYIIGLEMNSSTDIYPDDTYVWTDFWGTHFSREPSKTNVDVLQDMYNASAVKEKDKYNATTDDLSKVFGEIAENVRYYPCSNVIVTDKLSPYVQPVLGENEKVTCTIQVLNGSTDVTEAEIAEGGITAQYNEQDKEVVLNFKNDYTLKQNYIYSVTVKIEPSDKAYEKYQSDKGYLDIPDAGTGTHASDGTDPGNGIYSNTEANVEYSYNNERKNEDFPKPVVQLQLGNLIIEKTIIGLTEEELNDYDLSFGIKAKNETSGQTISFDGVDWERVGSTENYKAQYTLSGLRPGEYIVTEDQDSAIVNGCRLESITPASGNQTAVVTASSDTKVSFVNEYVPSTGSITIIKKDTTGEVIEGAKFIIKKEDNGSFIQIGEEETTDSDGKIIFDNLEEGKYQIIETQSKEGYSLLAEPIEVNLPYKIAKGEKDNITGESNTPDYSDETYDYYLNISYTIINNKLFDMPEAGGRNIFMMTLAGTAMIALAAGSTIYYRRRRGAHNKTRR